MEENALYSAYVTSARDDDIANSQTMRHAGGGFIACPSRRAAAADRNFDNNDSPPLGLHAAALGD